MSNPQFGVSILFDPDRDWNHKPKAVVCPKCGGEGCGLCGGYGELEDEEADEWFRAQHVAWAWEEGPCEILTAG